MGQGRGRARTNRNEKAMRRQVQEFHVLDPSGDGEKRSDSRHGLKVELARDADRLE